MNMFGIGSIIDGVGKIADDLITSDEERLKIALKERAIEAELVKGQLAITQAEAEHPSVFVAGWRPFIGWIGGLALAYQFLLYPLLTWGWRLFQVNGWIGAEALPPVPLDAEELWVVVGGMLGIAGLRSYDKLKMTDTKRIK